MIEQIPVKVVVGKHIPSLVTMIEQAETLCPETQHEDLSLMLDNNGTKFDNDYKTSNTTNAKEIDDHYTIRSISEHYNSIELEIKKGRKGGESFIYGFIGEEVSEFLDRINTDSPENLVGMKVIPTYNRKTNRFEKLSPVYHLI